MAERYALRARAFYPEGSVAWADITVRHCAQWSQQLGDCVGARVYLDDVVRRYVDVQEASDPVILALLHNRRAWLAIEQYGHWEEALDLLDESLRILRAHGIEDRILEQNDHFFRVRSLCETALTQGDAWLSALQAKPLASGLVQRLNHALEDDWTRAHELNPDNPHSYFEHLRVTTLIRPYEAQKARTTLEYVARQSGTDYLWDLETARWHFANEDWDAAASAADRALAGYADRAYPPGLALAAAVHAGATMRAGFHRVAEYCLCMDHWVLAIVLQPYPSHPVWQMARRGLQTMMRHLHGAKPVALRDYLDELDVRMRRRDGIFRVLASVRPEALAVIPNLHIVPFAGYSFLDG